MIAGIFHQGSGLGNQLHRYVAIRTLAADKGYEWGMFYQADGSGKDVGFKGSSFMNIDWPNKDAVFIPKWEWNEKKLVENGVDIRSYDPEFNFIEDNTIIDGEFQDERYFSHRLKEVDEWLRVEPIEIPDDTCVIGFRGGEYSAFPELFLPKEYWDEAIGRMMSQGVRKFQIHTDDAPLANRFFEGMFSPDVSAIHDVGVNWRSMRYAKHAIIANSSFYILPRLLSGGMTIAPRYWARRNTKVWALPQNYYKSFLYI